MFGIAEINTLLDNAQASGRISRESAEMLRGPEVFQRLRFTFGLSEPKRDTEKVTGICLIFDDSDVIGSFGSSVCEGVNRYMKGLAEATTQNEFLVSILPMNGFPICEFVPLSSVPRLCQYDAYGLSQPYRRALDGLGALILLREEALKNGQRFRGILFVMATYPHDHRDMLEMLTQLITDVVSSKDANPIIVIIVGIEKDLCENEREMPFPRHYFFKARDENDVPLIMESARRTSTLFSQVEPSEVPKLTMGA